MRKAKEEALCAIMLALALALSYMERLIPLQMIVPLPGIKLGLANIVTLVVLYTLKTRYALLIPRCCFAAAFGGSATGFWFSLCGGLLALGAMALGKKTGRLSVYGVSMLGAAAHNIGQTAAAMVLMNSVYIGAYLPYLLMVAIVTGLLTGGICAGVLRVLPKGVTQ